MTCLLLIFFCKHLFLTIELVETAYETGESGAKSVNCDFDRSPRENEVCTFPVASLGASQKKNPSAKEHKCNKEDFFGYADKSPCIFLKLNKIFDWKPEPYNDIEKLRAEVEKNTTMTPTMFKVIEERAKENPKVNHLKHLSRSLMLLIHFLFIFFVWFSSGFWTV